MAEHDASKPPAAWLDHLHEAGHWDRLVEMGTQSLAADPSDPETHRHLAWAYAKTGRYPELLRHVAFLLKAEPNDPRTHHLAAIYYLDTRQHQRAKAHIDLLLRDGPNTATYHYLACIHALRCNHVESARLYIRRARALDPNWVAAAHLEIKIDAIGHKKARDAWARVRRLKEALGLDPNNAAILTSIGDVLLNELERPREAEGFYRDALCIDPAEKACQAKLLDSIRARSLLYRTLSLPATMLRGTIKGFETGRIRPGLAIFAIKAYLLFAAWLLTVGAFFAPAAKVYEWLVLAEVTRAKTLPRILTPLRFALIWPIWLRMLFASSLIIGGWLLLLWQAFKVEPLVALQIMAVTFGIHLALICLAVGIRKLRAAHGQRQEARRLRREGSQVQTGIA